MTGPEWIAKRQELKVAMEELGDVERRWRLRSGRRATFYVAVQRVRGPGHPDGALVPLIQLTVKAGASSEPLALSSLTSTDLHQLGTFRDLFEQWINGELSEIPASDP